MTVENEYRGKRKDNGEWVYGYYCCVGYTGKEKHYIIPTYASVLYGIEVIPETVGQYIYRKDKNGKKVYEGDIYTKENLNYGYGGTEKEILYYVIKRIDDLYYDNKLYYDIDIEKYEIVGNIADNPELLKECENR